MTPTQTELGRIYAMPRCEGPTPEEVEALNRDWVIGEGMSLLPGQAYGLWSWLKYQDDPGLLIGLGVGQGKTLLSLLIASEWHARHPGANSMIIIPSAVHRQIWVQDIPWAKKNFRVELPIVSMGGKSRSLRRALAQAPGGRCFLMPYSLLSVRDTVELLRWINPDLIVADEAHGLKGQSAKALRFWDWLERQRGEQGPPVGVALSGTLTSRSPLDYYRIAKWTMTERCPLPRLMGTVEKWAAGLESVLGEDPFESLPQKVVTSMRGLAVWAGVNEAGFRWRRGHFREAYAARLRTTPGYVPPVGDCVGASLLIQNRPCGNPSEELVGHMRTVEDDWIDPSGEPFMYGLEKYELLRELSAGVWLRHYWPERPGVEPAKAAWEARGDWLRALRTWLRSRRIPPEGLDTPGLVHAALAEKRSTPGLPVGVKDLWQVWQVLLRGVPAGAPGRETEFVRVDPYKINAVVKWAHGKGGGIVWHSHEAVGDWLEEALREAGYRVLRKGAGDAWLHRDGSERFFCVASIAAHGTGKNLQHHHHQVVVQWERSATTMEQMLGRVHRPLQQADCVIVRTLISNEWDRKQMLGCLADTEYVEATMGGRLKLTVADYDPPFDRESEEF